MRSRSFDSKRRRLRSLAFSWPFRRLKLFTLRPRDVRVVVAPPHPLVSSLCELESVISGSNSCTCCTIEKKEECILRIRAVSFVRATKQTNTQTNKQTNLLHFFRASFRTNCVYFFFVGRYLIFADIRVSK